MSPVRHILMVVLGLIFVAELGAQPITVPGYRGKKVSLTASYSGSPWLNSDYRFGSTGSLFWNNRANLGLDIVTGRPTTIGFMAHYHRTWAAEEDLFGGERIGIRAYGPSVYLRTHPFGQKGFLAPVGNYLQFELVMLIIDAYDRYETITPEPSSRLLGTFFLPLPSITIGHNHIFFHRLMLSYGVQSTLRLSGPTTIVRNVPNNTVEQLGLAASSRGYGPFIFNVQIGLGSLLF